MSRIDDLFNNRSLRKALLAARIPIAVLLVVALLMTLDRRWFWPGLVVSAAGMALQLWVFGCIRTREILAVNGPYMYVRNPMYLARFLLVAGLVLMTGKLWLLLILTPLYYLYMKNRVAREEPVLLENFGEAYRHYREHVPRFLPQLRGYERGSLAGFSMVNFHRQHGFTNLAVFLLLYTACLLALPTA